MDTTAVFDLPEALARIDGDRELFLTLADLFLQESPKEFAAVRAALSSHDSAGLARAAHKLKGSVMQFCAPRLFGSTKHLEELGRQGRLAAAEPVCTEVARQLAELHDALRQLIIGGLPR